MPDLKLYMLVLGCKPKGRTTEQHDVFFGIAESLSGLKERIIAFWPEAGGYIHIDSYLEVTTVVGYKVEIRQRVNSPSEQGSELYFLNLGGYKPNDLEEYHYKMVVAVDAFGDAVAKSKETAFYKHTGFKGAESHIDDKYGIDLDDIAAIADILPESDKAKYRIILTPGYSGAEDEIRVGCVKMSAL